LNNGSFQAARIVAGEFPTKDVCTLVVPELTKSAFLVRIFKVLGAEGGIRVHLLAKSSKLLGNLQNLRIRFVFRFSVKFLFSLSYSLYSL
jgi:hypothetical protein